MKTARPMKLETLERRAKERAERRVEQTASLQERMRVKAQTSDWWAEYYRDVYGVNHDA